MNINGTKTVYVLGKLDAGQLYVFSHYNKENYKFEFSYNLSLAKFFESEQEALNYCLIKVDNEPIMDDCLVLKVEITVINE